MFRSLVYPLVFAAGLVAVGWIGAGYVGSNPLGAVIAALIGACYLAGGVELFRYRQATRTLGDAVAKLEMAPSNLGDWLGQLHPSLRNAVRLRVEGERAALPAPVLTPYLVGLLVLLGMLGTLLGMMATLRGTGLALESAADLQAMRGSLAAPVKGLGFAFGTSIAGVASSAMLGLLSALCRRERMQATQQLDTHAATTLRVFSQAHQRDEAFRLLQRQTELMPALVDRLQALMASIEQQNQSAHERQLAGQDAFHAKTETTYARLAHSVEQSLQQGVADSARAVSASIQPVVEATMAGLSRETAALREVVEQGVQRHLDGLSAGFETTTANVAGLWKEALDEHRRAGATLTGDLHDSLQQFNGTFEQRSAALIGDVASRLDTAANHAAEAWQQTLSRQEAANGQLAARNQEALAAAAATFEQHAASLVGVVRQSHEDLHAALTARDQERLVAWTESLGAMSTALHGQWEQTAAHAADRQRDICDTLAQTSRDITEQTKAHAGETIAEISRLVQAASEAPKAAAEVVAELRQKLSDSMVRDTAMLEERSRLLATVETLLDSVNHASTEQRAAVDGLIATSADLLDRVGTRFQDHVETQTGKLGTAAAHVAGGAAEVASLGEALGVAVQMFGQSNEALMERLQQIAGALDASLARSDEQLAYYVAQAREVVDLSMLSQKQIIEEIQQLAETRTAAGAETA
ncbi:DUF802 domain-containing protein [Dyella sp. LX-66]|uniref:DUF802 domain-containing protein n=1 Tax=unclassified Dyella TaxID=2634549 RepID=UPI001BE07338|nr:MULTISPECIES: DUF802 domain-containing protein [unclassified Dyella]MBT2118549.1 DUF802 domain-containing protein [Dyella sp. LX-1]MBT2142020.1 DUF802 domain-containing protein [Dyella sp. LX-66]